MQYHTFSTNSLNKIVTPASIQKTGLGVGFHFIKTPLMLLAQNGDINNLKLLLEKNANVLDNMNGQAQIDAIKGATSNSLEVVKILLAHGEEIIPIKDAIICNASEMIIKLLTYVHLLKGTQITDATKLNMLCYGIFHNLEEIVRLALEIGANRNQDEHQYWRGNNFTTLKNLIEATKNQNILKILTEIKNKEFTLEILLQKESKESEVWKIFDKTLLLTILLYNDCRPHIWYCINKEIFNANDILVLLQKKPFMPMKIAPSIFCATKLKLSSLEQHYALKKDVAQKPFLQAHLKYFYLTKTLKTINKTTKGHILQKLSPDLLCCIASYLQPQDILLPSLQNITNKV